MPSRSQAAFEPHAPSLVCPSLPLLESLQRFWNSMHLHWTWPSQPCAAIQRKIEMDPVSPQLACQYLSTCTLFLQLRLHQGFEQAQLRMLSVMLRGAGSEPQWDVSNCSPCWCAFLRERACDGPLPWHDSPFARWTWGSCCWWAWGSCLDASVAWEIFQLG